MLLKTTIYSSQDIRAIVNNVGLNHFMDESIAALERAFCEYEAAKYQIPIRDGFEYHYPATGLVEWMPTHQINGHIVLKIVGYHPSNPQVRQLPSVLSTSFSVDTKSGHVTGVMDSTFTTAIRTGAASAIASRILASEDSSVLGLIGGGAQAVSQLHALSRVKPIKQVLLFDSDQSVANSFSKRVKGLALDDVQIMPTSLEHVVRDSDIICTATSVDIGKGPVFHDNMLQSHVHINALGSDFPGKVEVPSSVLKRSLVCPDFLQQAVLEGECQQLSAEEIGPDIVRLVQNRSEHLHYKKQSTVFDSTGWALEDFVMSQILARYGQEFNCGTDIQLSSVAKDCKDPYGFLELM